MRKLVRKVRNEFEFDDIVDKMGQPYELVARDFALTTVAAALVENYGDKLCFKGGFVLRHVHGHNRFSKDLDATRINPPKNKLDTERVSSVIAGAGIKNLISLKPPAPKTDSGRGLDFDGIAYSGSLGNGNISIELSYREAVVLGPAAVEIGEPYYEPFPIPAMQLDEIVAEKLRALAQRVKPTDLSDIAQILWEGKSDANAIRDLAGVKFKLVRQGDRRRRIEENVAAMRPDYDASVGAVAVDAMSYDDAHAILMRALDDLLP